jgi:hypothetical protein
MMNTNMEKRFKWFWAWQDDKEETWLSEMAENGYHLDYVTYPCIYQFRRGEPARFVYRLDYQTLKTKDRESYLQLFADAGWEHVGKMVGWEYFRKSYQNGEAPDIYSDVESKVGKYRRIMTYLVIFLPILIILKPDSADRTGPSSLVIEGLFFILFLIYSYAIIQLARRIRHLKRR